MKCAILIFITMSSAWATETTTNSTSVPEWKFVKETFDGIKVYEKSVEGSAVLAFKGEGKVESTIDRVATVIFDTTRAPEWVQDLGESKIVRWVNPLEFIEYDHIKTPFVMADREFASDVQIQVFPEKKQLKFQYHPAADNEVKGKKEYVRGSLLNSVFVLTENGPTINIQGEILCDPKGGVPKWIVNMFQRDWPITTLRGLQKQLAKPDVIADKRFADLFSGRSVCFSGKDCVASNVQPQSKQ